MTEALLNVSRADREGADVVRLSGEVDMSNAGEIAEALAATASDRVILDLTGLRYVDSAGIREIDEAHRRLASTGRALVLVAPPATPAAWTFRVAGFRSSAFAESVDAALPPQGPTRDPSPH